MNTETKRSTTGQFLPGTKPGPGRPKKSKEDPYLKALQDAVPEYEFRRLVSITLAKAKAGDDRAREWIAKWLLGKERPAVTAAGDSTDNVRLAAHWGAV
ncbi:hypothetical protein N9N28_18070 [Rubripirellula amarantea]|nr:hypothetical protein [Rubripirellula amarantea]